MDAELSTQQIGDFFCSFCLTSTATGEMLNQHELLICSESAHLSLLAFLADHNGRHLSQQVAVEWMTSHLGHQSWE